MNDIKKTALSFPCDFVIKIFGNATDQFEKEVMEIIKRHQEGLDMPSVQIKPSKDGNYLSLSVNVHVESQSELDAIYQELTTSPVVIMAL